MIDINKFDKSIGESIRFIEEERLSNTKACLEKATALESYAMIHNQVDLLGYALFSKAYCSYLLNDTQGAFREYSRAIEPLYKSGEWLMCARSYSSLGILSSGRGNIPMAMDYYLRGLALCEQYNVESIEVFINCNIGVLYAGFYDIANASKYYQKAIERTKQIQERSDGSEPVMTQAQIATLYMNLAGCYCCLGDREQAQVNLDIAAEFEKQMPDEELRIGIMMTQAQVYGLGEQDEKLDAIIKEIDEMSVSVSVVSDAYDDIINYCDFLLKIDRMTELWNIITHLEELVKITDSVYMTRKLVELKIRYYKKTGNNKEYLMATGLFFELSMKMEQEQNKNYRETLSAQLRLENERRTRMQVETEAASLRIRSEFDALTGLHNRYKISAIWEENYNLCKEKKLPIAIEILDVDHFKQYNDNYGHQAGDLILQKVAATIKSLERHRGVYTGRYGGDEFLIVYVDHNYDEVIRYAHELKDSVEALKIPHEYSPVHDVISLSQGIHYGTPKGETNLWDFLYAADHALYHIKEQGRNNYCVTKDKE